MRRARVTEQPTSDDGDDDAKSNHRRRPIHLSFNLNNNWSKCRLDMEGKNLCQKNKIQLLFLCRPGQAKVSRLQYQFDREYGIWL